MDLKKKFSRKAFLKGLVTVPIGGYVVAKAAEKAVKDRAKVELERLARADKRMPDADDLMAEVSILVKDLRGHAGNSYYRIITEVENPNGSMSVCTGMLLDLEDPRVRGCIEEDKLIIGRFQPGAKIMGLRVETNGRSRGGAVNFNIEYV